MRGARRCCPLNCDIVNTNPRNKIVDPQYEQNRKENSFKNKRTVYSSDESKYKDLSDD